MLKNIFKKNIDLRFLFISFLKKIHVTISQFLTLFNYKYTMKYLILSKRSKALVGIGIVAISIGLVTKKVINYPAEGCVKGTQESTLKI